MQDNNRKKQAVGILAYGSLISSPEHEIERARTDIIEDVVTPFHVEFARSSDRRGGAPTLVPVTNGGAHVMGQVFVMNLPEQEATNVLYRREINEVGTDQPYKPPKEITDKTVLVERLTNFAGLDVVLYTKIAATIEPLTAKSLADLAIKSATPPNIGSRRDGISYLIAAREHGIVTALSATYEAEILRKTETKSLEDARAKLLKNVESG